MTFEDNIARVRELLIQRDEIDSELEGLIGGGAPAAAPGRAAKEKPEEGGKKKGNKCGKCGKRGHNAKTCPTATADTPSFGEKVLLTEDQFDDLKHRQSIGDLISKDFAADNGLALSEVNRAITSRNYEAYSHS